MEIIYSLLKEYSDQNPEKFNDDFIYSREKEDFMESITDIIKSLEIIDEIEILDVKLVEDESQFGPMKNYNELINGKIGKIDASTENFKKGYKPIKRSRLNKIIFTARITPSFEIEPTEILADEPQPRKVVPNKESYTITKELFINKLVDNFFFINDDIKYYLIYQLTDKGFYRVNDAICLKSLLMPITTRRFNSILYPEFEKDPVEAYDFESMLFSRKVNPIYYMLAKEAYNSIIKIKADPNNIIQARLDYRDEHLFDWMNKFFNTNIKFSDNIEDLKKLEDADQRLIFKVTNGKKDGVHLSVPENDVRNDDAVKALVSALVNFRLGGKTKKSTDIFTYDDLISPWFWINNLALYFTKSADYVKKFEKTRAVLYSLERLLSESNRKSLPIEDEHKKNIFTVFKYVMYNFDKLMHEDTQHIKFKKIRFWEPLFVGLQTYFSNHIFRIFNSTTRSKLVLDKVFNGLKKNYIVVNTSVNELFRYYNSSNCIMDLFGVALRYSRAGVQALGKTASLEHKDIHESFFGRLSLVSGSAGNAGILGCLTPFCEFEDDMRNFKIGEDE